jgi:hypothetical protein
MRIIDMGARKRGATSVPYQLPESRRSRNADAFPVVFGQGHQCERIDVYVAGEIVERVRHSRLAAGSLQRVADGAGDVDRVRGIRMDAD